MKPTEIELPMTVSGTEPRVDSRDIAAHIGVQHQNTFEMLKDYKADFEQFGILRFETGIIAGRGKPQKFAMLNEDQCYLLLTYCRNSVKVRALKVKLVKAFGEARRNRDVTQAEYLPTYRALHDEIHALAAGSQNEKFVHMNLNKLVNKTAGIGSGQRAGAALPTRSMLVTAQMIAAAAMRGAGNHREGYEKAKAALTGLGGLMKLNAAPAAGRCRLKGL